MTIRLIATLAVAALAWAAQAAAETTAITNAHIYTMGKPGEIASGTILMRDGRISAVGAIRPPPGATIIDAKGRVVTPGLYIAGTNLGANEVELIASTQDTATKNSALSAAFDIQYGIDGQSVAIPVARMTGVTRAVVTPGYTDGGERQLLFAGQAAIITLREGANPIVRPRAAMMLELGESGAARAGGGRGATIVALKADFDDVRWYARQRGNFDRGSSRDLRLSRADLEALQPVIRRQMPLIVSVNRATDILAALALAKREGLKIVLSGAAEGWMVAREIAKAGVPVLLNPTANLPADFEQRAATMENAARLHAAGVTIAFANADGAARIREVRYNAGNAVANGLPYGAALAALTVNPARIFGEGAKTGSIEPGKLADLVIWNGDPLEPRTHADAVYIAGEAQPLTSRGQDLARRYKSLEGPYPPAYKE
jgi:imidazolonepropionase-like amidohydrolase